MQHQGRFNRLRLTAVLGAALVAAAAPAPAQEPAPQSLFGEVIDVRVVNLEVVVTSKGERVTGLGAEDFTLEVDGQEIPIEYFTEVKGGVASARGDGSERAMVPALVPGEPVGTSYLLFIDDMFSIERRRNMVLRRMLEQLPHLQPQDRMAVVAYDGRQLETLGAWNHSPAAIEEVLEDAMTRRAYGMHQRGEERTHLASARSSPDAVPQSPSGFSSGGGVGGSGGELDGGGGPGGSAGGGLGGDGGGPGADGSYEGFSQERQYGVASSTGLSLETEQNVEWLTERLNRVVTAATASLRSFADSPGRKVMLLMSGGWPDNPTEWLLRDTGNFDIRSTRDRHRIYGQLIETANRLSYTLYPIDVPGANEPISSVDIQRATLRRLASQTGGRAMLAGDGLRALEKTVSDTRSYYWIGFVPQWKGDDREHKVAVDVRRKGADVRTRRNFSDLSRQREVSMMVESSMRLGGPAPAVSFPARIGDVRKAGAGKVKVPLEMLVPVHELTFLPYRGHFVAEVELRIAIQDERGTSTDIPMVPVRITLDELPQEEKLQRWSTTIRIRREKHDVMLSFFDPASGRLLSSRLEVDPKSL